MASGFLGLPRHLIHWLSDRKANYQLRLLFEASHKPSEEARLPFKTTRSISQKRLSSPWYRVWQQEQWRKCIREILPHPAYSPDVVQSHFHLFNPIKAALRGRVLVADNEVKTSCVKMTGGAIKNISERGIMKVPERLRRCIDLQGDVQKDRYYFLKWLIIFYTESRLYLNSPRTISGHTIEIRVL
jgi:hypothetical protein